MLVGVSSTDVNRKTIKRITSTYVYGKTRLFVRGQEVEPHTPYIPMTLRDMYQRTHPQYAPAREQEAEYENGDIYYTPLSSPSAGLAWL